jgi:CRP/FNR family transcriptional regulator, anaerobic regulatory protein
VSVASDECVALVPIFARLSAARQAEVARFARPATVDAGDYIVHEGERTSRLFIVHEGQIKVSSRSPAGHESVLSVLGPGDVVGEMTFLTGGRPDSSAVAVEPSRVCVFDHADLAALLGRFPDVAVGMLRALALKLSSTQRMLAAMTSADVGSRVAAYLLDAPTTWDSTGTAVVHLPMSKKDVAAYLGTTPETLSRRLAEFERAGLITLQPGRDIVIRDPGGLEARAT